MAFPHQRQFPASAICSQLYPCSQKNAAQKRMGNCLETISMPTGELEDLILSALQHAQPHRLSMRSILKRVGVSAIERKRVDDALSSLMERKLVAISTSQGLIPKYYTTACGPDTWSGEFPGFRTSMDDVRTKMAHANIGPFSDLNTGNTENVEGITTKDNWTDTIGGIIRTSSPVLGLICDEDKQEQGNNCAETNEIFQNLQDHISADKLNNTKTLPSPQCTNYKLMPLRQGIGNVTNENDRLFDRNPQIDTCRDLQNMALELAGDDIPLSNLKALRCSKVSKKQWQNQAKDEALKIFRSAAAPKIGPKSRGLNSLSSFSPTSVGYLGHLPPDIKNRVKSDAEVAVILTSVMRRIYPNASTIGILADSLGLGKDQVSRVVIHHLHKDGIFQKLTKGKKHPPLWRLHGDIALNNAN